MVIGLTRQRHRLRLLGLGHRFLRGRLLLQRGGFLHRLGLLCGVLCCEYGCGVRYRGIALGTLRDGRCLRNGFRSRAARGAGRRVTLLARSQCHCQCCANENGSGCVVHRLLAQVGRRKHRTRRPDADQSKLGGVIGAHKLCNRKHFSTRARHCLCAKARTDASVRPRPCNHAAAEWDRGRSSISTFARVHRGRLRSAVDRRASPSHSSCPRTIGMILPPTLTSRELSTIRARNSTREGRRISNPCSIRKSSEGSGNTRCSNRYAPRNAAPLPVAGSSRTPCASKKNLAQRSFRASRVSWQ